MSNIYGCYNVCMSSSGCMGLCKEHNHDIGTQCGATTADRSTSSTKVNVTVIQQQQNLNTQSKQLEVVPLGADGYPVELESYVEPDPFRGQPAALVPSKVPQRQTPPFINILVEEHHITPYMQKVHVMSRFNTLPESDLNDIEAALDI